jgi:biopolymer transport protein TolQ
MSSLPLSLLGAAAGSVDLITAIKENDPFGKFCLLVLAGLSIWSLTVILLKVYEIQRVKAQTRRFQKLIDGDGSWETLFTAAKKYEGSPLARLLKETYVECRLENWFSKTGGPLEHRMEIAKATVENILMRVMSNEETRLHSQLTILATVTTLAPFIGLFGTVWGVLGSFQAMGREGSAALAALAPGISTALVTTIFGLIAAIPALIFYNYFMREVHKLTGAMESFSHEIENAVRKQILMDGGK